MISNQTPVLAGTESDDGLGTIGLPTPPTGARRAALLAGLAHSDMSLGAVMSDCSTVRSFV